MPQFRLMPQFRRFQITRPEPVVDTFELYAQQVPTTRSDGTPYGPDEPATIIGSRTATAEDVGLWLKLATEEEQELVISMVRGPTSALERVRRILLEDWDPLGVNQERGCFDEYDSYVSGVLVQLRLRGFEPEIDRYLEHIETEKMGLPRRPATSRGQTVEKLLAVVR